MQTQYLTRIVRQSRKNSIEQSTSRRRCERRPRHRSLSQVPGPGISGYIRLNPVTTRLPGGGLPVWYGSAAVCKLIYSLRLMSNFYLCYSDLDNIKIYLALLQNVFHGLFFKIILALLCIWIKDVDMSQLHNRYNSKGICSATSKRLVLLILLHKHGLYYDSLR